MSALRTLRPLAWAAAVLAAPLFSAVATAQASPSAYTSGIRYDLMGRQTGTIAPDPDGTGSLKYAATRNTYDNAGRLIKVETGELSNWQGNTTEPVNWTGFTVYSSVETTYDAQDRKLTERVKDSTGATVSLTQYSYDVVGRLECTAVRMNTAEFASPPASACTLDTEGSNGPDRIIKNIYDDAGQVLQIRRAVGTSIEQAYASYTYTDNGKQASVTDANGNRAEMTWDGYDRQKRWIFPHKTSVGNVDATDYEEYGYDANGNRTSLRKRDGISFAYTFDALNRMTLKNVPTRQLPFATNNLASTHTRDVYYTYDAFGNQTGARFDSATGEGVTQAYDGFSRTTSSTLAMDSKSWPLSYQYDSNGNRTRITHPDGEYFKYSFDGLDRLELIENTNGQDLVEPEYNSRGLVNSVARISGAKDQSYSYDNAGRLSGLSFTGGQSSSEVAWTISRNAAGQVLTDVRDNDSYAFGSHVAVTRPYAVNGLNQYTSVSGVGHCSDKNGSVIWDGTYVYMYDAENRLVEMRHDANRCPQANSDYTGTLVATLRYDPLGRLYEFDYPSGPWKFRTIYDGDANVAEYYANNTPSGTGQLIRRFVHGSSAGADDPLLWFEGTTSTSSSNAKHLYADRLGSIVLVGDSSGSYLQKPSYDAWGVPSTANTRFLYTGQAYYWEIGLYYYKARMYSPLLGRFMQTDPIGYDDQVNLYGYVWNDPINGTDPTGTEAGSCYGSSKCGLSEVSAQDQAIQEGIITGIAVVAAVAVDVVNSPISPGPDATIVVTAATQTAKRPGFFARIGKAIGRLFSGGKKTESTVTTQGPRFARGDLRRQVLEKGRQADGNVKCTYCDKPGATTSDHVIPYSKGGPTKIENLDPACVACNSSKGNRDLGTEWIPPKDFQ